MQNKFGINALLLIKYLDCINSKKFYERLRTNYILNIDYIKIKALEQSKNNKKIHYFITFDCFEKICMMSRTVKGNSVRDYFIILRKFINYYKENFENNINKIAKGNKYVYIILVG